MITVLESITCVNINLHFCNHNHVQELINSHLIYTIMYSVSLLYFITIEKLSTVIAETDFVLLSVQYINCTGSQFYSP